MGVSVMSLSAVKNEIDNPTGTFLVFQFEDVDLEREFYMVYNKNTTLSPAASRFRDYVESRYMDK